jgi:plasmid stability protein
MPDVLVRDVDAAVLEKLKSRAAESGRSLQSEVRFIISDYVQHTTLSDADVAKKIKNALRRKQHTDTGKMLREDRMR